MTERRALRELFDDPDFIRLGGDAQLAYVKKHYPDKFSDAIPDDHKRALIAKHLGELPPGPIVQGAKRAAGAIGSGFRRAGAAIAGIPEAAGALPEVAREIGPLRRTRLPPYVPTDAEAWGTPTPRPELSPAGEASRRVIASPGGRTAAVGLAGMGPPSESLPAQILAGYGAQPAMYADLLAGLTRVGGWAVDPGRPLRDLGLAPPKEPFYEPAARTLNALAEANRADMAERVAPPREDVAGAVARGAGGLPLTLPAYVGATKLLGAPAGFAALTGLELSDPEIPWLDRLREMGKSGVLGAMFRPLGGAHPGARAPAIAAVSHKMSEPYMSGGAEIPMHERYAQDLIMGSLLLPGGTRGARGRRLQEEQLAREYWNLWNRDTKAERKVRSAQKRWMDRLKPRDAEEEAERGPAEVLYERAALEALKPEYAQWEEVPGMLPRGMPVPEIPAWTEGTRAEMLVRDQRALERRLRDQARQPETPDVIEAERGTIGYEEAAARPPAVVDRPAERMPEFAEIEEPVFASGLSRPGNLLPWARQGHPVGFVAGELSDRMTRLAAGYAEVGGHVFLDSGAYERRQQAQKVKPKRKRQKLNFDDVLDKYEEIAGMLESEEAFYRLHVVAPDVVGDQAETMKLVQQYAPRLRALIDQGVRVLIPYQKGADKYLEADVQAFESAVNDALGTKSWALAVPFKANAFTQAQFLEIAQAVQNPNLSFHLLGGGQKKVAAARKAVQKWLEEAQIEEIPEITGDSNRARSLVGQKGKVGKAQKDLEEEAKAVLGDAWDAEIGAWFRRYARDRVMEQDAAAGVAQQTGAVASVQGFPVWRHRNTETGETYYDVKIPGAETRKSFDTKEEAVEWLTAELEGRKQRRAEAEREETKDLIASGEAEAPKLRYPDVDDPFSGTPEPIERIVEGYMRNGHQGAHDEYMKLDMADREMIDDYLRAVEHTALENVHATPGDRAMMVAKEIGELRLAQEADAAAQAPTPEPQPLPSSWEATGFARPGNPASWEAMPLAERDTIDARLAEYLGRDLETPERELIDIFKKDLIPPDVMEVEPGQDFWFAILANPKAFAGPLLRRARSALVEIAAEQRRELPLPVRKARRSRKPLIDQVGVARGEVGGRYLLEQVEVGPDTIVATDGHRMHIAVGKHGMEPGRYIPITQGAKGYRLGTPAETAEKWVEWRRVHDPYGDLGDRVPYTIDNGLQVAANLRGGLSHYGLDRKRTKIVKLPEEEGRPTVYVNVSYLADALDFAGGGVKGDYGGAVTLYVPRDPNMPIVIRGQTPEGHRDAVTMPVRMEQGDPATFEAPWNVVARPGTDLAPPKRPPQRKRKGAVTSEQRIARDSVEMGRGVDEPAKIEAEARPWVPEKVEHGRQPRLFAEGKPAEEDGAPGRNHHLLQQLIPGVPDPDMPASKDLQTASFLLRRSAVKLGIPIQENTRLIRMRDREARRRGETVLGTHYYLYHGDPHTPSGALDILYHGDLQTAGHELTHGLVARYPELAVLYGDDLRFTVTAEQAKRFHAALEDFKSRYSEEEQAVIRDEVNSVSYDVEKPEEGLTELMRGWLTQTKAVNDAVPNATRAMEAHFRKWLPRKKWDALMEMKDDFHRFYQMSLIEWNRTRTMPIERGPNDAVFSSEYLRIPDWVPNRWARKLRKYEFLGTDRAREDLIDRGHPWRKAETVLHGKPLADGPYEAYHRYASKEEIHDHITRTGVLTYDKKTGEFSFSGPGAAEIFAPHMLDSTDRMETSAYLRAVMASELFPQRIGRSGKVIAPEDFAAVRATEDRPAITIKEAYAVFREARAERDRIAAELEVERVEREIKKLLREGKDAEANDLIEGLAPYYEAVEAFKWTQTLLDQAKLRMDYLAGETRERGWLPAQIHKGLGLETPERVRTGRLLREMHNKALDFLEATGTLSPEMRARFRRDYYMWTLMKQFYSGEQSRRSGRKNPLDQGAGIHTLRGSSRPEMDMIDATIYGMSRSIDMGLRNLLKQKLYHHLFAAPGGGVFGREEPPGRSPTTATMGGVKASIIKSMREMTGWSEKKVAQYLGKNFMRLEEEIHHITEWNEMKPQGDDVLTIWFDGKPRFVRVTDPGLMRAWENLHPQALKGIARFFDKIRTFYQGMIILNPEFPLLSNFRRDVVYASIGSRVGWQHFTRAFPALWASMRENQQYLDFIANGGGHATRYASPLAHERAIRRYAMKHFPDNFRVVLSPKDLYLAIRAIQPLRAGQFIGRHFESAMKFAEYKAAVEAGETKTHAAYLGREVSIDFAQHGANPGLNAVVRSMPFVSAMINGNDNFYRKLFKQEHGGRERQMIIAAKAATYALFSTGLAMSHMDEEWWNKLETWQKLAYDFVDTGMKDANGEPIIFMWPGPFEPKWLANFWTITAEHVFNEGLPAEQKWWRDQLSAVALNFGIDQSPVFQVWLEQAKNEVKLTGQQIETPYMQGVVPAERRRPSGKQVFNTWGDWMREMNLEEKWFASPARMEQLWRSLFGTLGWMFMMGVEGMNDEGVALRWDQHIGVRRLLQAGDKYDKDWGRFWKIRGELNLMANTAKRVELEQRAPEVIQHYRKKHDPMMAAEFNFAAAQVGQLGAEIKTIREGRRDASLGGSGDLKERRRDAIRELRERALDVIKPTLKKHDEWYRRREAEAASR